MKPVIFITNYYQNIYITLGQALDALNHQGMQMKAETLLPMFNRCESHGQCMDLIERYVDVIERKEA